MTVTSRPYVPAPFNIRSKSSIILKPLLQILIINGYVAVTKIRGLLPVFPTAPTKNASFGCQCGHRCFRSGRIHAVALDIVMATTWVWRY